MAMTDDYKAKLEEADSRIKRALEFALRYGGIDGAHHKSWVIDQMCRALLANKYKKFVKDAKAGEDGPNTYDWDEGIPP